MDQGWYSHEGLIPFPLTNEDKWHKTSAPMHSIHFLTFMPTNANIEKVFSKPESFKFYFQNMQLTKNNGELVGKS